MSRVGSSLATITTLKTTQCNIPRNQTISKITIHHAAGVISGANLQGWGRNPTCGASWHYGVCNDGVIGQLIDERNRPWTSSSGTNDHQAITLEVANSKTAPTWDIGEKAWNAMLNLLVDICKRNPGIKQKNGQSGLYFDGTPNASLTIHKFFSNTSCPGAYIEARLQEICTEVNKRLSGGNTTPETPTFKGTPIMGKAIATAEQMAAYLISKNPATKDYAAEYARLFISEGNIEGVRGDVAFAQSCLETGNFKFGGDVKPEQNNFAGIGATGGGVPGNSFTTPQIGIRAQIHHLKAYASTAPLVNENQSPRFQYVTRGSAEFVEWLGQKNNPNGKGWATDPNYGEKIISILNAIIGTAAQTKPADPAPTTPSDNLTFKNGDIVQFTGGDVYRSSTTHIPEHKREKSLCTVTQTAPKARNQYHLISEDKGGVHGWVVSENVTARTNTAAAPTPTIKAGSKVKIKAGAKYYSGKSIPAWVMNDTWIVSQVNGDRAVIDKNVSGKNSIMSPIKTADLLLLT